MGRLDAIRFTGRKLEIAATNKLNAKSNAICLTPNERIVIRSPTSFLKILFTIADITAVPVTASTKFIIAMIKLSAKNILKTSLLLEPIARRIPISRFL